MDAFVFTPPADLIEDYEQLKPLIENDVSGEKVIRLIEYFDESAAKCQEVQVQSTDFEEKEFARMTYEAFGASKRIVMKAWKQKHGSDLVVPSHESIPFDFTRQSSNIF
jgi:hypothetical protein